MNTQQPTQQLTPDLIIIYTKGGYITNLIPITAIGREYTSTQPHASIIDAELTRIYDYHLTVELSN